MRLPLRGWETCGKLAKCGQPGRGEAVGSLPSVRASAAACRLYQENLTLLSKPGTYYELIAASLEGLGSVMAGSASKSSAAVGKSQGSA